MTTTVDVSVTTPPYHFTGKERDSESGLDNFGARYYEFSIGRFVTPDWAAKATAVPYADLVDPSIMQASQKQCPSA